jgi:dihydrofolate synthase/folylpolyglutamate synthase
MKDKDYTGMLESLSGGVSSIVVVAPKTGRALSVRALFRAAEKTGVKILRGGSVERGLSVARRIAGRSGTVLVTGSHYVVGEAMELMQKKT